jgi:formiminoglutamase
MTLHHDPHWPRASAWLSGGGEGLRRLAVLGAPLHKASISPGRCDLAPPAIRKALERYSPHQADEVTVADLGDLPVGDLSPEEALDPVSEAVSRAAAEHDAVVLLGGDNSVTRPGVLGLSGRCGLLTLDAHLDLRHLDAGLHNGNPVRALLEDGLPGTNIVQIGIQDFANSREYMRVAQAAGITVIRADKARESGVADTVEGLLDDLAQRVDVIYVDLDIDVLDRAFAPGAPGSRPGGWLPWELRAAARACGQHRAVKVMDIVELDPERDRDDATALAAAACLLEFAAGLSRRER